MTRSLRTIASYIGWWTRCPYSRSDRIGTRTWTNCGWEPTRSLSLAAPSGSRPGAPAGDDDRPDQPGVLAEPLLDHVVVHRSGQRGRPVRVAQRVDRVVAVPDRVVDVPGVQDVPLEHRDVAGRQPGLGPARPGARGPGGDRGGGLGSRGAPRH